MTPTHMLLQLLPNVAPSPRLLAWAQAFDEWIAWLTSLVGKNHVQDHVTAWRIFLERYPMPPWEIDAAMLETRRAALEKRGRRPITVKAHIRAIRSFYAFCCSHPGLRGVELLLWAEDRASAPWVVDPRPAGSRPTPVGSPPASGTLPQGEPPSHTPKPVARPQSWNYILRPDEARRLLRALIRVGHSQDPKTLFALLEHSSPACLRPAAIKLAQRQIEAVTPEGRPLTPSS